MKHSLSLVLLLACGFAYASDIDLEQWNELKHVISKHKSLDWAINFNRQYPKPSEAGVRELAQQLDFTEEDKHRRVEKWSESNPSQLCVAVNGESICLLTPGKCTSIICAVRQEIRQSRNNQ
jgi:hypothetical protein